tara:strand:- start:286 stop:483 length:198 start_codon:yes stop_codon:yes gene_type:complete
MKNAIKLVDELIFFAEMEDQKNKKEKVSTKGSSTIGESFMVHHLKMLKEELKNTENEFSSEHNRP